MRTKKIKRTALDGMLCALAFLSTALIRFPLTSAEFLTYDPKDVIVVLAGLILGPIDAIAIAVVSSLLEMVTISTTGWIGFLMNALSTIAFALPSAVLYEKMRTLKGAILGLFLGVCAMSITMLCWNLLLTPFYMGVSIETVKAMLLPIFLPFNLTKGTMNAVVTLLIYKPVVGGLRRAKLIDGSDGEKGKIKLPLLCVCLLIFALCIAMIFLWKSL